MSTLRELVLAQYDEVSAEVVLSSKPEGAQMVDEKWYVPKWGCDTLEHILDDLSLVAEDRRALVEACEAYKDLLACYRLGKKPSEKLLAGLERADAALAAAEPPKEEGMKAPEIQIETDEMVVVPVDDIPTPCTYTLAAEPPKEEGMMAIPRYEYYTPPVWDKDSELRVHPDGDWVRYDDHLAEVRERERAAFYEGAKWAEDDIGDGINGDLKAEARRRYGEGRVT